MARKEFKNEAKKTRVPPQDIPTDKRVNKSGNTESSISVNTSKLKTITFKVHPDFKRKFKQAAIDNDMKMNELFAEMLDFFIQYKAVIQEISKNEKQ